MMDIEIASRLRDFPTIPVADDVRRLLGLAVLLRAEADRAEDVASVMERI